MTTDNEVLMKLKNLCDERNWSIYRLAKESGVPYSSLNNMFLRNTQPTINTLEKLCSGLNISMSTFFMENTGTIAEITLNNEEKYIIEIYRQMDRHTQEILLAYLDGLQKRRTPAFLEVQKEQL